MSDERIFFFLNLFSVNKKIIIGNTLRYLLKIDLLIHERDIGRKMRDARTIKLLGIEIGINYEQWISNNSKE